MTCGREGDFAAARPLEELCDTLLSHLLPSRPRDDVALLAARPDIDHPSPPEGGGGRTG